MTTFTVPSDHDEGLSDSSLSSGEIEEVMLGGVLDPKKAKKKRKRRRGIHGEPVIEKKRSTRRTAASITKLTDEVEQVMRLANDAYLQGDIPQAIRLYEEVVRQAPGIHDPFHNLGVIYENDLGDVKKALEFYLLAVHLVPSDGELWKRIATMSQAIGNLDQAIYCYQRCIRTASNILDQSDAIYEVSKCYMEKQLYSKAAKILENLFERHSGDQMIGRELAKCYHHLNRSPLAVQVLRRCLSHAFALQQTQGGGSLVDLNTLNVLCEVYLELKQYKECDDVMSQVIPAQEVDSLPLDLHVKYAIARLNINDTTMAYLVASRLLSLPLTSRLHYEDLFQSLSHPPHLPHPPHSPHSRSA
eukprot:GHVN01051293.1.p1 GENE.GHVN01051293.1~~GHVN01051293.1.p1  ORF type:complete len:359 (+),score=84.69 GHVN01051293.1:524-1600(+)